MFHKTLAVAVTTGVLVMGPPASPQPFGVSRGADAADQNPVIAIPPSLEAEHHEIHEELSKATRRPGRVGAAAKELAAVLEPHFERENEIALPPLSLLAPLAAGGTPPGQQEVLAMTDALVKEMPRMLDEHRRIRAEAEKLRAVAREENAPAQEQFAERLVAHAQTEEEILYPAAILVGEVIRARMDRK